MKKAEEVTSSAAKTTRKAKGFTDEERSAMKERAKELKTEASRGSRAKKDKAAEGENDVLSKIAEMSEPDRSMAARLHEIIKANAPELAPKTWYGMPSYANKEGKIVCFFQAAQKFGTRYASFGFNDTARLDDGHMWPSAYALKELTPAEEKKIAALVKKAVS